VILSDPEGILPSKEIRMVIDSVADWSPEEIRSYYSQSHCHVMAQALSRSTGLAMWNGMDWHIEPDEDGLGGVREVVHVYVDCGDGNILDVAGIRPIDDMRREFAPYEWEVCPCSPLSQLRLDELVEQTGNLVPYDEDEIEEALEVVARNPELVAAVGMFAGSPPTM
jgi:hypothetical protein